MSRRFLAALYFCCTAATFSPGWESHAAAAGFAFDENFIIQAPNQKLAESILAKANAYRAQLSEQWLNQPLVPGEGKTLIHVDLSEGQLRGRFNPRETRADMMHTMWLEAPQEQAEGAWLERYIAQIVLETRHPIHLPAWAFEGVAAQHDAESLQRQRAQMLLWCRRTGRWPNLEELIKETELDTADRSALATAASLIEFLESRADKATVIQFLVAGKERGWEQAISETYQFKDCRELQLRWQAWVTAAVTSVDPAPDDYGQPRYVEWDHGGASARSENFTIYADDRQMASDLLQAAERLRKEIAIAWLGESLPPGVGRTIVSVKILPDQDRAQALIQDPAHRVAQMLWIRTTPDKVHSALAHEITHTVFATRYADELPIWAHEGVASQQDDPGRRSHVKSVLREMVQTGQWPPLEALLVSPALSHSDSRSYATAASLTEFLTSRGDNAQFLAFAVDGKANGWDVALRGHYRLANVRELQSAWQRWASGAAAEVSQRPTPMDAFPR